MLVGTQQRKQRNSTKVNLVISAVFHTVIVVSLLYFAAREGLLGKQIKTISLEMVRKEPEKPKVPDKPKEPPKTAVEEVKTIQPKITEVAKIETAPKLTAPPPSSLAPGLCPAAGGHPLLRVRGRQARPDQFGPRETLQRADRERAAIELGPPQGHGQPDQRGRGRSDRG